MKLSLFVPGLILLIYAVFRYPPGYFEQQIDFDFFNYAGLHRPVYLYTTPQTYVDDILINTNIDGSAGL